MTAESLAIGLTLIQLVREGSNVVSIYADILNGKITTEDELNAAIQERKDTDAELHDKLKTFETPPPGENQ